MGAGADGGDVALSPVTVSEALKMELGKIDASEHRPHSSEDAGGCYSSEIRLLRATGETNCSYLCLAEANPACRVGLSEHQLPDVQAS